LKSVYGHCGEKFTTPDAPSYDIPCCNSSGNGHWSHVEFE
jgi:hypothetical protein